MKNGTIKKAGGIVRDGEKFFVVKRNTKNGYTDISLPKGHIDPGESTKKAALREVLEETGLECKIVDDLGTVVYKNYEGSIEVRYFAMKVIKKVSDEIFPDVSEVITGNYDDIIKKLSYDTDKIILEKGAKFFGCIK